MSGGIKELFKTVFSAFSLVLAFSAHGLDEFTPDRTYRIIVSSYILFGLLSKSELLFVSREEQKKKFINTLASIASPVCVALIAAFMINYFYGIVIIDGFHDALFALMWAFVIVFLIFVISCMRRYELRYNNVDTKYSVPQIYLKKFGEKWAIFLVVLPFVIALVASIANARTAIIVVLMVSTKYLIKFVILIPELRKNHSKRKRIVAVNNSRPKNDNEERLSKLKRKSKGKKGKSSKKRR